MRPIQFHQDKQLYERKTMVVSKNVSSILYSIRKLRHSTNHPFNKKRTATLLTEYYSILFNNDIFRTPYLSDLSLLFPIDDDIYISKDTNFILLPLQLPTYRNHTQAMHNDKAYRLNNPCPFVIHTSTANEFIHDMDYYQDNRRVMRPRQPQELNISYHHIQHTNPQIKQTMLEYPLDLTARLRVYKFNDIPPEEAKQISTFPNYDMRDRKFETFQTNRHIISRQYTFLEITPPESNTSMSKFNNKLQTYSKYLEPSLLTNEFRKCFDFNSSNTSSSIKYFMDNMDWVEFNPTQILSWIRRLKNIIRYKKPISVFIQTNEPKQKPKQIKSNQHIRSLNIKQSDWTYKSQLIEDTNITNRIPLSDIKPLWLSQQ